MDNLIVIGKQDIYSLMFTVLESTRFENVRYIPVVNGESKEVITALSALTIDTVILVTDKVSESIMEIVRKNKYATISDKKATMNEILYTDIHLEYGNLRLAIKYLYEHRKETDALFVYGAYGTQCKLKECIERTSKWDGDESTLSALLKPLTCDVPRSFFIKHLGDVSSKKQLVEIEARPNKKTASDLLDQFYPNYGELSLIIRTAAGDKTYGRN